MLVLTPTNPLVTVQAYLLHTVPLSHWFPGSVQSSVCQSGGVGMGRFLPLIFTWGLIWTSECGRSCVWFLEASLASTHGKCSQISPDQPSSLHRMLDFRDCPAQFFVVIERSHIDGFKSFCCHYSLSFSVMELKALCTTDKCLPWYCLPGPSSFFFFFKMGPRASVCDSDWLEAHCLLASVPQL